MVVQHRKGIATLILLHKNLYNAINISLPLPYYPFTYFKHMPELFNWGHGSLDDLLEALPSKNKEPFS